MGLLLLIFGVVYTFLSSSGTTNIGTQPHQEGFGDLPVKYRLNVAINMT